jgi:uncharacterized protein YceK
MKRIALASMALALVGTAVLLGGCSTTTEKVDTTKVWGYVASADKAQLEVDENQNGATELVVKRVLAPSDGWIVVHADMNGKPGMRVGLTHVKKGESINVKVKLKDLTTPKVIVAVHADRGTANKFDFDMMNKEMSADRPFFVAEKELAKVASVREFGVPAAAGSASVEASDQPGATTQLVVTRAVAPTDAWVVVHLEKDGGPGGRVGLVHIPAGESLNVTVPLEPLPLTGNLLVAIHADKADPGLFNFDMEDKINSADTPFFVDGKEVAVKVRVK